ncbi:MGMT family protein [Rhodococcus triatomae]|uniref:methylated-DNA--[protein]-cysteine S-methyltransferase n=1 Tax=Rhodococcus triatomae TaxID=300028 RepID=A0A1G8PF27_9NOCA|nr:methylated-DNA--[protein]-cysteine S-methyltransferase [Rhodococcus triatomae]QNG20085.1 MGMT family protein [Rhodococcus triatomae]QNG23999.1 MGMT family protein [Rhodococcus triatomae]SDI91052.1 methylated-DNA-[protein]-cysteine S-methyltransferase [Rhodococcus triatomae]
MTTGFALFDTALGTCALAWRATGIVGLQLPESSPEATLERIVASFPTATEHDPPPAALEAMELIRAHLSGSPDDLRSIPLDFEDVPEFDCRVYEVTRSIGPGNTLTYGDIAREIDVPGASQAVGQALGRNPIPLIVPCHRVLAAGGAVGGFSAGGGTVTKRELLALEHVPGFDDPTLF